MTLDNQTTIPDDYVCSLHLRIFKHTMIHVTSVGLLPGRRLRRRDDCTLPVRHFWAPHACLVHYLSQGWPSPTPGATWRHEDKYVGVYADDLFLCPRCGRFDQSEDSKNGRALSVIRCCVEEYRMVGGQEESVLDADGYAKFRAFAQSRLETKEFYFKECEDAANCEAHKRAQLKIYKREYCTRPITNATIEALNHPKPDIERKKEVTASKAQFVYLIKGGDYHKIGIAKDTRKRVSGIKTSCPFPVEVLRFWESRSAQRVEKLLHRRFKSYQANGEWFRLPTDVIQELMVIENIDLAFPPS